MNIVLEDVARKTARGTDGVVISDNKLDLSKFTGSEVIISGKYAKGLNIIVRPQIQVTFKDVVIDNATTNVTVKIDGTYDQFKLEGINAKLFGKAGNAASQMIFFNGVWSNVSVGGFEIDQRRDNKTGSTTTGAAVQFAGVLESSLKSLGKIALYNIIIKNAGDEGIYVNHFKKVDNGITYADGEELFINNVKVYRSGRDFLQQQGMRNVTINNCYGENGGLESDSNHNSALSMNDGETEFINVINSTFVNVGQLAFVGASKVYKKVNLNNVTYDQGTHAGAYSNQAMYLKGNGEYFIKNSKIIAPNAKRSLICADGSFVNWDISNTFIGPRMDYSFNKGLFIEQPLITTRTAEVIEERTSAGVKYFLNWNGQRIQIQ